MEQRIPQEVIEAFIKVSAGIEQDVRRFAFRYEIRGMDMDDKMQEFWIHIVRKYGGFDPSKASLRTWVWRLLNHKRIDLHRRTRRDLLDAEGRVFPSEDDPNDPLYHALYH